MTTTDSALRQLRKIERQIKKIPNRFRNAMKGKTGKLANRALSRITREPGRPIYPLRWQTERQRRAFFATRGFGRGIPYRRTGGLLLGWTVDVDKTKEGVDVVMRNPSEVAHFVQGDRAQKFHRDTGWVQVDDVMSDFYREAEDSTAEIWYEVCEEAVE